MMRSRVFEPRGGLVRVSGLGALQHCLPFLWLVALGCSGSDPTTGEDAVDADEDGFSAAEDCDDGNAEVNPEAAEVCDGIDNDCNELVDDEDGNLVPESAQRLFADADDDGFGDPSAPGFFCEPPKGWVRDATDCDDEAADVHPERPEYCDGRDNDCNPATPDEGVYFVTATGIRDRRRDFPDEGSFDDDDEWSFVELDKPGTLYVCPGTWFATIVPEADVSIIGVGGSGQTTLHGAESYPGVWVDGDHDVTVRGLTLQSPFDPENEPSWGAGLHCASGATVTAEDVIVQDGRSQSGGAMSATAGCDLTLQDSVLRGGETPAGYGGLLLVHEATATIRDTTFEDGVARWHGGALAVNAPALGRVPGEASVTCTNCTFENNLAGVEPGTWGGGGAFVGPYGTVDMIGGRFADNDGDQLGGSVYLNALDPTLQGTAVADLTGVRFDGNQAFLDFIYRVAPNDVAAVVAPKGNLEAQAYYDYSGTTVTTTCDDTVGCGEEGNPAPRIELDEYALSIEWVGIGSSGNVEPFESDVTSPKKTVEPSLFVSWYTADQHVCTSEYGVSSTTLSGGPFSFAATTSTGPDEVVGTWNAWKWTLTLESDDCEAEVTAKSYQTVQDLFPSTVYAAIAPLAGVLGNDATSSGLGDQTGLFGIWAASGGATDPSQGGQFEDRSLVRIYEWDGSSVVSSGTPVMTGLSSLATGDNVLTGAVLIDLGGLRVGL